MAMCSAYGCLNRPSMKTPGITFHKFPTDVEMRDKWIKAIRRKNWVPAKNSQLCSDHFASDQFDHSSFLEVCLIENAVPTIFKANPNFSENLQSMDENSSEKKVPRVNITENKFSIDGVCAEMIVEVADNDEPVVSNSNPAKIFTTTNQDEEISEENNTDPQKVNFAKTLGLICPSEKGEESESGLANDMPEVKTEIISDEFEMASPTDSSKVSSVGKDSKKKKKRRSVFLRNISAKKKKTVSKIESFEILPGKGIQLREIRHISKNLNSPKLSGLQPLYRVLFNIWPLQELSEIKEQILEFSGFNFTESSPDFKKRKQMLKMLSFSSVQNICTILGLKHGDRAAMTQSILKFLSKPYDKSGRAVDKKMQPIVLLTKVENDPNIVREEVDGHVTYGVKKAEKTSIKKRGLRRTTVEKKEVETIIEEKKEVKKTPIEKREVRKTPIEKREVRKTPVEKREVKKALIDKKESEKVVEEKKEIKKVEVEKKEVKKVEKKEIKKSEAERPEVEKKVNDIEMIDVTEPLSIQATPSKHGRIRKEKLPYSPPEKESKEEMKKPRGRPSLKQPLKIKFSPKRKAGRPPGAKNKSPVSKHNLAKNFKLKATSVLKKRALKNDHNRPEEMSVSDEMDDEAVTPRRSAEKRKQPDHYGEWIRDDTSDTFSAEESQDVHTSYDDDDGDNEENYETPPKKLKPEKEIAPSSDSESFRESHRGTRLRFFPSIRKNIENASSSVIERLHVILYGTSQTPEEMRENLLNFDGFKFLPNSDEWKQKTFFLSLVANNYLLEFTQILNLVDSNKGGQKLNNMIESLMNFLKAPSSNYLKDEEKAIFSEKKIKALLHPESIVSSKTPGPKSKKTAPPKTPKPKPKSEAEPRKESRGGGPKGRKMLMDESEVRRLELEIAREERAKRRSSMHDPLFKGTISFLSGQDYAHTQAQSMLTVIRNNRALKAAGVDPIYPTTTTRIPKLGDNSHVQFMIVALNYPDLDIIHNLIFLHGAVKSRIRRNILDFQGFKFDEYSQLYACRERFLHTLGLDIVKRISFIFGLTPLNTHLPIQDLVDLIMNFLISPSKVKQVTIKEFPPNFFQDYPREYPKISVKGSDVEDISILPDLNNSETFTETENVEAFDEGEQEESQSSQEDKAWTSDDLDNALQCIADGSSVAVASNRFNIPQKTLRTCLRQNQQELENEQKSIREADMENLRAMSSSPLSVSSGSTEDVLANISTSKASKKKDWTPENLKLALIAVKKGSTVRNAAAEYNIPRSTLNNYVKQIWGGNPNVSQERKLSSAASKKLDDDEAEGIPIAEVFTSEVTNKSPPKTIKVPTKHYDDVNLKTPPKLVQTVMPVVPVNSLKNTIVGQPPQPTQICYILKPGTAPGQSSSTATMLKPLSSVMSPSLTSSVQPTFVLGAPTQSILSPHAPQLQSTLHAPPAPSTPIQLQVINSAGDSIAQPGKQIFLMKVPQPGITNDSSIPPLKLLPLAPDNATGVPPLKLLPISQAMNPISPMPIKVQQNSTSTIASSIKTLDSKKPEEPVKRIPRAMKSFPNAQSRTPTLPSRQTIGVPRVTESSTVSDDSESNRSSSPEPEPQITLSSDEEEEEDDDDDYDDSKEATLDDDDDDNENSAERAVFLKVRDIIHSSSMEDITLKKITDKLVKYFPNLDPSSNQDLIKNSIKRVVSGLTSTSDD